MIRSRAVSKANERPLPIPGGLLLAVDLDVDRELRARIRFLRSTPVLIALSFRPAGRNLAGYFPVEKELDAPVFAASSGSRTDSTLDTDAAVSRTPNVIVRSIIPEGFRVRSRLLLDCC
jgi:hypothetical protein